MFSGIAADFPLLQQSGRGGKRLVYLDSAATSQKPQAVLDAEIHFYERLNGAVARGAHYLAEQATEAYSSARAQVAAFIGAPAAELVWASGATGALNMLTNALGNLAAGVGGVADNSLRLGPGDEILLSVAEHHANLIPWQILAEKTGAQLRWIPVDATGCWDYGALDDLITPRTKFVALAHASNVTGEILDVRAVVTRAHAVGAKVVLDACQTVPHIPLDVTELQVDFLAFSSHKMLGPTGVGALWGKFELLSQLPPAVFGGSAIQTVTLAESTFLPPPERFEPGTQPVAQIAGFAAATAYLSSLQMECVWEHEQELAVRLRSGVQEIPGVTLLGPQDERPTLGLAAVVVAGVHAHDVGQVLDDAGIAVRVGHHCAQPLHRELGITGSTRASTYVYNTVAEVDLFLDQLSGVRTFFGLR